MESLSPGVSKLKMKWSQMATRTSQLVTTVDRRPERHPNLINHTNLNSSFYTPGLKLS